MQSIIFRHDLIKQMRSLPARHVFLSAPGGYGKTVAAAQCFASGRRQSATITVGDGDSDSGGFFRRIAQALCRLTGVKKPPQTFTAAGIVQMPFPVRHARCHLLIDDLHKMESGEALDSLPLLAARLPGYVRLCVASRLAPPDALAETGLFAVLTREDLLFSPKEAELLAAAKECDLTPRQIHDLLEATGGWAMYLSALLSDGRSDGKVPLSLERYLETRVWNAWDEETRRILCALAVPEGLVPELCERLTGRPDGGGLLKALAEKPNAFLSRREGESYRFHDIFREFLLLRAGELGEGELRRLNSVAAEWFFGQGDYYASTGHFIKNHDQEGISRCIGMTFKLQEKESSVSVELRRNFTHQYILKLPEKFVVANPHLLIRRAVVAYHDGKIDEFTRDLDLMYRLRPEMAAKYPDCAVMCWFFGVVDFRVPVREHIRSVLREQASGSGRSLRKALRSTGMITQNLPFYHRSMRDFSEYHELDAGDLRQYDEALGVFMRKNYAIYEECLIAGLRYEKGDLLDALRHAVKACERDDRTADASPEALLTANAILAQTLYALGPRAGRNRFWIGRRRAWRKWGVP